MKQIIYVDVLIFLNTAITFLLLLSCKHLLKLPAKPFRMLSGSALGGISSLIIFAPETDFFISLFIKLCFSFIITGAAFGTKPPKALLIRTAYFFAVSFCFGGIMLFVSSLPDISIITYQNGAVYIDFSFISLIFASVLCYLITLLLGKLTRKRQQENVLCSVKIVSNGKEAKMCGIIDTGNSLRDPFSDEGVIVCDKHMAEKILPDGIKFYINGETEKCTAIRFLPCTTVTSQSLLPLFRAESAEISSERGTVSLNKPLIAVSGERLINAILPPDIYE